MLASCSAKTERTLEAFRRPVIIVARTFVPLQPARSQKNKPAGLVEAGRRNVDATAHGQGQTCMLRIW
jgi:hypothetical protein